jgi:hypothetical protein
LQPSSQFARNVSDGLFDEYLGDYRFRERPDLSVTIVREGSELVSYGSGQRSVLASHRDDAFIAAAYDGEGHFQRDSAGAIVGFVYYEFGARLGIAERIASLAP